MPEIVAVDIGGTKIAVAQVIDGAVVERTQSPTPATADGVVAAVASMVAAFGGPTWVGVAATGVVRKGVMYGPNRATIEGWWGYPLESRLSAATGAEVRVVNDAQAAAWGEYVAGTAGDSPDMVYVTVSTGIGAGVVLDGRLVGGATGVAGHLGHTCVDPTGEPCACGRRGCLEGVASGRAIERRAAAAWGGRPSARLVLERAGAGDPAARHIIDSTVTSLASALADLAALLDPSVVVLGGSVGFNAEFAASLARAISFVPEWCRPRPVPAQLGRDAGLVGVARLVHGG